MRDHRIIILVYLIKPTVNWTMIVNNGSYGWKCCYVSFPIAVTRLGTGCFEQVFTMILLSKEEA